MKSHFCAVKFLSILTLLSVCGQPSSAQAESGLPRHDAQRTGLTQGASDLSAPETFWRVYLGGSLGASALLVADVDGAGEPEVVFVSGGRIVVKTSLGQEVWASDPLGIGFLVGIEDVDGDAQLDVVASSNNQVYVLRASDGEIEWAEPSGEMGSIGGVRLGDLDGDGLSEVVIEECACCGVNSGNPGYVYSFGAGFGAPTMLWEFPFARCGGGRALTLVNADGLGPYEVLISDSLQLALFDGASGVELGRTPNMWEWIYGSNCQPIDVDADAGEELVCVQNVDLNLVSNVRTLFVLDYDATNSALNILWSVVLTPNDGGGIAFTQPAVDLDLDGSVDIVLASLEAAMWTTRVFDSLTGTELGSASGQKFAGTAVRPDGSSLILTTSAGMLTAYDFDATRTPALETRWATPDRAPIDELDSEMRKRSALASRVLMNDTDGDGNAELYLAKVSEGDAIYAYNLVAGLPAVVDTFAYPSRFEPLRYWLLPPLNRPYPQLAVARNDGYLTVFDEDFMPIDIGQDGGIPGIRIGGYYASGGWRDLGRTPLLASFDGSEAESIAVRDSRGALIFLDARNATSTVPPQKVWQRTNVLTASVVEGLDGNAPGLVCTALQEPVATTPVYLLKALDGGGQEFWSLATDSAPLGDVLPAKLNADNVPDVVMQWGDPSNTLLHTRGVSGVDGSTLWDGPVIEPGAGRQPAGVSVGDFNGDGIDDVYTAGAGVRVISGVDGSELNLLANGFAYAMATLYNLDADAGLEVVLHGSYQTLRAYDDDLATPLWTSTDDDRPYPYGAIAPCSDGRRLFVSGSWQNPARLKVTDLLGTPGAASTVVFGGGSAYVDEVAAQTDGAWMGQLTSVNVHADLTGSGEPTAVVGSTDGWLYAYSPCQDTLAFSVDFGAAVGESVFGDTDGDGLDELLVSVADGYLYDLRHHEIAAPDFVWDTDPAQGITDRDVATITTADTLSAVWAPVAGATGYEVGVVRIGADFISTPRWQSVTGTEVSLSGLSLENNTFYAFVVRALGATGPSVDAVSNGVLVRLASPPTEELEVQVEEALEVVEVETDAVDAVDVVAEQAETVGEDTVANDVGAEVEGESSVGTKDEGCGCRILVRSGQGVRYCGLAWILVGCILLRRRRRERA
ncbi:MAG: hypothetical protein CO108_05400 [Deltaproteobacteria bacterium CG_4_9_14_3_um_filter_63_12]|nr:MAG: hypothetical protein CO108_05400 [Deltaproteobacteria bacterium CG_4_9_14_3_um_filter_63_12]